MPLNQLFLFCPYSGSSVYTLNVSLSNIPEVNLSSWFIYLLFWSYCAIYLCFFFLVSIIFRSVQEEEDRLLAQALAESEMERVGTSQVRH